MRGPATFVWLLAAAAGAIVFARARKARGRPYRPFPAVAHVAVVFGLALIVAAYAFFNVKTGVRAGIEGGGEILFQDGNAHGMEPGGFWTKGGRGATILIRSPRPLSRIRITLTSPIAGLTSLRAGMAERIISRPENGLPPATIEIDAPPGFRMGGGYLYSLRIEDSGSFSSLQARPKFGRRPKPRRLRLPFDPGRGRESSLGRGRPHGLRGSLTAIGFAA